MKKAKRVKLYKLLLGSFILLSLNSQLFATESQKETETVTSSSIITQKVEGKYFEVVQNIRSAILGKGINIAHELHASDMLQRTAPAYGYSKTVYSNAEILEFCSAALSQKLSRINPANIVMCPFTIGVYALADEPNVVYINYQVPRGKPGTEAVEEEIKELISGIIEDAAW